MIDEFLLLKLNRSVWVSLIRQGKIMEGINYFEIYINNLIMLAKDSPNKERIEAEIKFSNAMYVVELTQILENAAEKRDYSRGAIVLTALLKYIKNEPKIIRNGITCLNGIKQYDLADNLITHLENLSSDDPAILKEIAEMYANRNSNIKSVEYMEKYLANKKTPITGSDYNVLGCYYHKLYDDNQALGDNMRRAIYNFEKAVELNPDNLLFIKNTTVVCSKFNEQEKCGKYWEKLLERDMLNNDDKFDYGAYCLKNGNFAGWEKYNEFRFQKENNATVFPKLTKRRWDGKRDISGSTLLVHYEQGFGDTFLMYGYLPRLKKLAKHVIYVVQDSILPLLRDNEYGIEVISHSESLRIGLDNLKYDYYLPSMSIPAALKLDRKSISVGEGYLKAPEELVEMFKEEYMNNDKFKIGICTGGSTKGDKTRDVPPEDLLGLNELENVQLYSLMVDTDIKAFKRFDKNPVINLKDELRTFAETAAVIENMDLVLTTDNVILNLAGALGKKTFALFNWNNQFRWFDLTGENVGWYTSVKPFVNDSQNNWQSSANKAIEEIKTMI